MAPFISTSRGRLPDERHVIVHTGQHYNREMLRRPLRNANATIYDRNLVTLMEVT